MQLASFFYMDIWCYVVFEALSIKQGHMLWPKYKLTGGGFCLFRIPGSVRESYIQCSPKNNDDTLLSEFWADFLENHHFEWSQPTKSVVLNPDEFPPDAGIRRAAESMRRKGEAYFLSLNPPANMSDMERSFYAKHDVFNPNN